MLKPPPPKADHHHWGDTFRVPVSAPVKVEPTAQFNPVSVIELTFPTSANDLRGRPRVMLERYKEFFGRFNMTEWDDAACILEQTPDIEQKSVKTVVTYRDPYLGVFSIRNESTNQLLMEEVIYQSLNSLQSERCKALQKIVEVLEVGT